MISISLTGQIVISDGTTGTVSLQKQLSLVMSGITFSQAQTVPVSTTITGITLPIALVQFAYIKNLHAANTVDVHWAPTGQGSTTIITLQPGSAIILSEGSSVPTSGITSISLQANVANTPVEYILGG